MEDQHYAGHLARDYDRGARQYRADDEIEAQSENHRRLGGELRQLCRSFPHAIRVLEIGCGTGRYFHWLENVELLVGTDISQQMLKMAEHPLHESAVTAKEIRLVHGNVFEMEFAPESFDLIYSLGVFGYGAVWTPAIAAKVHGWLSPGGRLFFDAIKRPHSPTRLDRLKQSVKCALYPALPEAVRNRLNARQAVPMVPHTARQIDKATRQAGFRECIITSQGCQSPLWNGVHLECQARKK